MVTVVALFEMTQRSRMTLRKARHPLVRSAVGPIALRGVRPEHAIGEGKVQRLRVVARKAADIADEGAVQKRGHVGNVERTPVVDKEAARDPAEAPVARGVEPVEAGKRGGDGRGVVRDDATVEDDLAMEQHVVGRARRVAGDETIHQTRAPLLFPLLLGPDQPARDVGVVAEDAVGDGRVARHIDRQVVLLDVRGRAVARVEDRVLDPQRAADSAAAARVVARAGVDPAAEERAAAHDAVVLPRFKGRVAVLPGVDRPAVLRHAIDEVAVLDQGRPRDVRGAVADGAAVARMARIPERDSLDLEIAAAHVEDAALRTAVDDRAGLAARGKKRHVRRGDGQRLGEVVRAAGERNGRAVGGSGKRRRKLLRRRNRRVGRARGKRRGDGCARNRAKKHFLSHRHGLSPG